MGIKKPNIARLGMVCRTLTNPTTGRRMDSACVSQMAAGIAMAAAIATDTTTRKRCSSERSSASRARSDHILQHLKESAGFGRGRMQEFARRGDRVQVAIVQQRNTRSEGERFADIVRHKDGGGVKTVAKLLE